MFVSSGFAGIEIKGKIDTYGTRHYRLILCVRYQGHRPSDREEAIRGSEGWRRQAQENGPKELQCDKRILGRYFSLVSEIDDLVYLIFG